MTSIDERIVNMKFNNGQFLSGISSTLSALSKLQQGLSLKGSTKGINDVNTAMAALPPATIAAGIEAISGRFTAMSAVAVTVLSNITTAALAAGTQLVKSLTIDPVTKGLEEYETNLNSIQTILANTGLEGEKGLSKVEKALDELNHYSDKTIYNFSEMARNIGTFTAAGVSLDDSTAAIKGIANLAAVSGSNSQQASTAMYQLSQAMSAGKVTAQDWISVVNAGMGGKVFRESLKETARVHGVAVDDIVKDAGSFKDSLQEGWITGDILTETLSKFTGDLNKSQLKTMGYNEEQIKGILKMGVTASDAATKVKTMSQLIGTLQETAQSGWAQTWESLFGNFNEAKALFTSVNDVLGAMIGESANARNKMVGDWKKLGGRTVLIEAIADAFNGLVEIAKPVGEAFRDIFPATTGKQLFALTENLAAFTKTIKIGATDAENLRRTFAGVFAVFSIAGSIIQGLFTVVGRLFGAFGDGAGDILNFTGGIGDFLVSLDQAIKKSDSFTSFFENLGDVLSVPIQLLSVLATVLAEAFSGFDGGQSDAVGDSIERIGSRLEPFAAMGNAVAAAWGKMGDVLQGIWDFMAPFTAAVSEMFGGIGQAIADSVSTGDFSTVLDTINTGLFAALVLAIKNFTSDGSLFSFGGGDEGGFLDSIKEAFGGLNDTLGALQANLKSGTLIKIAGAVALLTASVVALSMIDSGKLAKALGAITIMFGQLAGAMFLFDAVTSAGTVLKLAPMAAGLILLSTAILILTGAVKVLSTMSWEDLAKGLGGLIVLLGAVAGAVKLMSGSGKGLIAAGAGMLVMSVGIKILASAVADLSNLSWDEMIRGLAGLAGSLAIIAGAMKLMPGAIPGALAMLIVAPALVILAGALKIMASMSWEDFGKSMAILAGGLLIIAGALYLMVAAIPGALAMLIVAPALVVMALALQMMATMSWEDFGKSMAILAGSLLILAVGLTAMIVALPGALALIVAAGALGVLAPILILFGAMSWEAIGKGLTMLAASLAIIGIAGALLTPVIPTLLGLGAAIALMGVGMLAAGAGLLAFSLGLTALSVAGAAGTAAIVAIVSALIGLIPMAMNAVAKGIVLMANVIGGAGPQFVRAMTTLMNSLLTSINKTAPRIINTIWNLVLLLANRVADGYPKLVSAGLRLITGVLNGIANNIGGIVTAAVSIITNFINALAANLPRITQAGANLVISFIESLTNTIENNSERMRTAGQELAFAIVDGMTGGLLSGASDVIAAAADMASNALATAKSILGIASPSKEFRKIGKFAVQGFADGITGSRAEIRSAMGSMRDALGALIKSTEEDVNASRARLKDLRDRRKADLKDAAGNAKKQADIARKYNAAIAREEDKLQKARVEHRRAHISYRNFRDNLDDEARALHRLASQYDNVSKKLEAASQKLTDAKKTRDDYNRSIRDQYSGLEAITKETKVTDYLTDLRAEVEETNRFAIALQELRARGLGDKAYKHLLAQGADALPFAQELIAGGSASINELNSLGSQLNTASSKLGKTASSELYQAGVDAAQGLVNGLKKQQKAIQKQMDKIAGWMVNSIKRRLGIKSPSKEFAKIGDWSVDGLVKALKDSSSRVQRVSEGVGDTAITALEKSMRDVSKAMRADIDMTPTIRPVLDLSKLRKDSAQIDGIMSPSGLKVDSSYSRASTIAVEDRAARREMADSLNRTPEPRIDFKYEQNISSPKATSNAEIYRQTKNSLSQIKRQLPVSKGVSTK